LDYIRVDSEKRRVSTVGLSAVGIHDMAVVVESRDLLEDGERLLRFLADYQRQTHHRVKAGQTAAYGYWTIRCVAGETECLDVWEVKSERESHLFVPGANRALRYWRQQSALCRSVGSEMMPPHASHRVSVSAGVLEGTLSLEGVRYPSATPNSGWYLTTDLYDGDIRSMRMIHLEHLTAARPEVVQLLGLAFGYRFEVTGPGKVSVCYDTEVAGSEMV
jgi:hypothetical protein